jgi:beta-glucanase (GH16 family)
MIAPDKNNGGCRRKDPVKENVSFVLVLFISTLPASLMRTSLRTSTLSREASRLPGIRRPAGTCLPYKRFRSMSIPGICADQRGFLALALNLALKSVLQTTCWNSGPGLPLSDLMMSSTESAERAGKLRRSFRVTEQGRPKETLISDPTGSDRPSATQPQHCPAIRVALSSRATLSLLCFTCLASGYPCFATNVLSNPGFEKGPAGNPVTDWQWYGQNWNTLTVIDPAHAHSGSNYFKVYGAFTGVDNFNGVYRDVYCAAGATFVGEMWAFSLSADGGGIHGQDQIWAEVTFRDARMNTLALYRSDLISSANITNYGGLDTWFKLRVTNQWSFTDSGGVPVAITITNTVTNLVAPAGTLFVRYQLVFHQGPDNANGSAYFDDCMLDQIAGPVRVWNIVWSDEFNGNAIDPRTWTFDVGDGGWGNSELEYYTSRLANAYVSNGLLHVVARQEAYNGSSYTSARLKTQSLYARKYGRFEFRARLPSGLGFWPSFWMLGSDFATVGWPACGEIDVLESRGAVTNQVQGTIHFSGPTNNHLAASALYTMPNQQLTTDFHTYALEWTTNLVRWYFDDQLYESQTSWSSSTGPYPAPFNQPFFFIVNLAVGGNYVGNPTPAQINANTVFPGELQVDYIRVLDLTPPLAISTLQSNGNLILSWPTNVVCHLQAQTNSTLSMTAWQDVPGGNTSPYLVPLQAGAPAVLYRLESP